MSPDRRQLEELVRRHARAVGAVCWARIGRAREVEDLVQETFLRACRDFGALRDPGKFGAWVKGIAENVCLEWLRAKKKQAGPLDVEVAGPEPEAPGDGGERIRAALAGLPEIYRETLALFHFERRSYREIAELLGLSEAAVNARLTKGREMLRRVLKGVEDAVR